MKHSANIVFANVVLDNVTSAMCKHQQWVGLDIHFSPKYCI